MKPHPTLPIILLLSLAAIASLLVALCSGSVTLHASDWVAAFSTDQGTSLQQAVLIQLRLPRALTSFALGGQLAL
ncbi:MAG: iron chelate uptake ABC transporter family permease subunit, partial [Steroidobacteraceae bacterium]